MQTATILLSDSERQHLHSLLSKHMPGVQALAYGSRVNGTAHECSDLDIALIAPSGTELSTEQLSNFRQALSDSNIPILIDAHDWARLPKHFQQEINRLHAVLA
jgi:uncharacterized protein